MPSSCPKVVRKQPPMPTGQRGRVSQQGRPRLRVRGPSSLVIADGFTTEAALCQWADWFARFHSDPAKLYVPIALRTVDCVVSVQDKPPMAPWSPRLMRCVREVAKFNGARGVEWKLITWVPGLPGAQFQQCASHDDAMTLLDAPPSPVSF